MRHKSFQLIIFMAFAAIFSCSDPALIGSELLQEDQANLQFTDELLVQAKTVEGDPLQTFSPFLSLQLNRHPFGNFADPLLGTTKSSIYTQVALGIQAAPENEIISFDSVVLSLAYDTLGNYGNISEEFDLDVFLVEEEIISTEDYFADQTFQTGSTPIGSIKFVPAIEERVTITDFSNGSDSTVSANPHVRIHLNDDFQNLFKQDTAVFRVDSLLRDRVKGIYLAPSASSSTAGIINFNFNNSISKITFYYKQGGRDVKEFDLDFNIGNPGRTLNFVQDFSESIVNPFIENGSDSLVFIQGLKGFNAEITFPEVEDFRNIVVNKAELELTVASLATNDTSLYPLTPQLIASFVNSDNNSILPDVRSAIFANNPINSNVFGGVPEIVEVDGVSLVKYRINLSGYFQQIIEDRADNSISLSAGTEQTTWYFQLPPKPIDPSRVIFYGPNHPQYPLKLNLTYTKL